jgi:FKBP-type peptidyl-prolyl cis-trans isomerase
MRSFSLLVAMVGLTACGSGISGPSHVTCDPFLQQYGSAPADTINSVQGLRFIEITAGTGSPAVIGTEVDVNYSGYLLNGTRFDTSCPSSQTALRVLLGNRDVIPGFEQGLVGMQPGGVRRVIIPPNLGYGSAPVGPIPANSTLVFDLQLIAFVGD